MKVIVTGGAGFIGSRVAEVLAEAGVDVWSVDNINDYYDRRLKMARLSRSGINLSEDGIACYDERGHYTIPFDGFSSESEKFPCLKFTKLDVRDPRFESMASDFAPDVLIHLAAQPGVRYSIANPEECLESNVMTFMRVMEVCRMVKVRRMLYASSSSVYGNHSPHAFREADAVDSPKSVYAASKRTNEMLAGIYAEMYGIRTIGLRFFSVYGEWGRPDMAPYIFANAIINNQPIKLFNAGQLSRDFTYIEDVAECVRRIVLRGGGIASIGSEHDVLNVGNGNPTMLFDFVSLLEDIIDKKADLRLLPMQPGEVKATLADTSKLNMQYGFVPSTPLRQGLSKFVSWLGEYEECLARQNSHSDFSDISLAR